MKFINQELQACHDAQDWAGLMKEADKIFFCGSKQFATSQGGVKLFENGKLQITESEVFQTFDRHDLIGREVIGHRKVVANKPRRGLYPADFLLSQPRSNHEV
jgi:hypothetical protein